MKNFRRSAPLCAAFHRPTQALAKVAIKMSALNRPNRMFKALLEQRKIQQEELANETGETSVFELEQERCGAKPSQMLTSSKDRNSMTREYTKNYLSTSDSMGMDKSRNLSTIGFP